MTIYHHFTRLLHPLVPTGWGLSKNTPRITTPVPDCLPTLRGKILLSTIQ